MSDKEIAELKKQIALAQTAADRAIDLANAAYAKANSAQMSANIAYEEAQKHV